MERRKINLSTNKDGHGTVGFRISLPKKWVQQMGFDENNKNAIVEFDGEKIIIIKKKNC